MTVRSDNPVRVKRRWPLAAALTVAVLAVGLAAVYGFGGFARNPGDPACRPALAEAQRLAPLTRGEVAAVKVADVGQTVPLLAFKDARGEQKTLADWRGRLVLAALQQH